MGACPPVAEIPLWRDEPRPLTVPGKMKMTVRQQFHLFRLPFMGMAHPAKAGFPPQADRLPIQVVPASLDPLA